MNTNKIALLKDDSIIRFPMEDILDMFAHTDENGFLRIPEWPYDNKDPEEPEYVYVYKMNWNWEDCDRMVSTYLELEDRLQSIAKSGKRPTLKRIIGGNRDISPFSYLKDDLKDAECLKSDSRFAAYDVVIRAQRYCELVYINAPEMIINNEARLLAQALTIHYHAENMEKAPQGG
ncbi:MAG: hypothetical protein IKF90_08880 [Parasporobacterium sp.]|nr:hypothetical protein [Parasporobacterium sp.]